METSLIFLGGPVLTLDEGSPSAEALWVEGDKIAYAGSEEQARALAGPKAKIVDLAGRTLIPGFIDGHGHFMETGRRLSSEMDLRPPPAGQVKSLGEVIELVRQKAEQTPEGEWIKGFGYDDTLLSENRHPLAGDIDEAAKKHPVALRHVSGHFLAVNSLALSLAGLGPGTIDPKGGRLRRLADGSPSGLLEEPPAMDLVARLIAPLSREKELEAARAASANYAAQGVTTAQDGWTGAVNYEVLKEAADLKAAKVRVQILPDYSLSMSGSLPVGPGSFLGSSYLTLGPSKLFADGSLQGYTGFLSRPYHRLMYGLPQDWRGYPMTDKEALIEKVSALHKAGRQVAVHAHGDEAIESVLEAFKKAQKESSDISRRHFVIHCQTVRADQLDRMARLGILASFFVSHVYYWGDRHRDIFLGLERAEKLDPLLSAKTNGIAFSLHNDSPVTPISPLRSIETAVLRRTSSGRDLGAEERLDPLSALRAVTADAAYLAFEEDRKGRLKKGFLADLAVLSDNPLTAPSEKIAQIKVLATVVGGETVFGDL
ncbi:MAG: amidohydrolase [Deltaproteobacteria bacterium]|jgi:predicted amidohydrolase YtcJ|nr:amidohydrolase [Deltaproteobacteria bacterium]